MTGPEAELEELVRLIRTHGSAETILGLHRADGSGRCRVCRAGGDSSGHQV